MKKNNSMPEAYVAVGKNRQKIYGENTVYLNDRQEFEFELFNSTQDNIMAKISINGKPISNRGIILRPGVRGWIERYIDENRRFLFETYTVDGNSDAVKKAIENNGDIKLEFFREKQKQTLINITPASSMGIYNSSTANFGNVRSFTTTSDGLESLTLDLARDFEDTSEESERAFFGRRCCSKKSIETGRVEKGSASDQRFTTVDMDFEYFPFHTVIYKLMPVSQKPAEFNDLKIKCKSCGANIKSNWKFCPSCGKTVNSDCYCTSCGTKVESEWNFCPKCNTSLK